MVQLQFYEATRILFVCKENKNNDFIQQFLLICVIIHHAFTTVPRRMCSASGFYISIPAPASAVSHACVVVLLWTCVKDSQGREDIVQLSGYFYLFSRSFITLRLNHWCHMDYFNDVCTTFLGLECVSCVAIRVRKLSDFIKNILICVLKMNEGLMSLVGKIC